MFGRDSRKNSSGLFLLSLLLLNGNIETNPGPQYKYPCGVCSKAVKCNQKRIQCDTCEVWYHTRCCAMNDQMYDSLANYSCIWVCTSCGLPNFSSSLLDSFSGAESFNSFEPLGDVITNSTTTADSTTNSSYPSPRSSTPSRRNQNNQRSGEKLNKLNSLRVLTVNCCSLRSVDKRQSFDELVIEHNPDVICGTESHLSDEFFTAEVFSSTFNVIRKERPVAGGGGVFVAVHSKYIASHESSFDSDCEILWVKLNIQGSKPLYIGCYYRLTDRNIDNVHQLGVPLERIQSRGSCLPNILLTGDFNVPAIDWELHAPKPNPQYGMEINENMCDILAEHNLSQCNKHSTRLNNILDLLCSTSPGLVKSILAYPGMSDHSVIVTEVNMKARLGKKTPRQIYIYGKGDMNAVKKDMDDLYQSSFSNDENEPVDYLWSTFTKGLLDSVKKNIPQKTTSRRWNLPYITTNIKRLINTKKKLYNKAKKTQSETDWSRFKKIRKHIKFKLREVHDD